METLEGVEIEAICRLANNEFESNILNTKLISLIPSAQEDNADVQALAKKLLKTCSQYPDNDIGVTTSAVALALFTLYSSDEEDYNKQIQ